MKLKHLNSKEKLNYIAGRIAALSRRYDKIKDSYYIEQIIYYTEKLKAIQNEIETEELLSKIEE